MEVDREAGDQDPLVDPDQEALAADVENQYGDEKGREGGLVLTAGLLQRKHLRDLREGRGASGATRKTT